MNAPTPDPAEQWSRLCGVLGHPIRLRILILLARSAGSGGARSSQLRTILGVAKATLEHHLSHLRRHGLVTVRRAGRTNYFYELTPRVVVKGRSLTVSAFGLVLAIEGGCP